MIELLSLIIYFDAQCTIPAVKREHAKHFVTSERNVDVIYYYKLNGDKCERVIEPAVLNKVLKHD
jgi:hypothetical protein